MELTHGAVSILAGLHEFHVALFKLFFFHLGICECLCNAYTCNTAFKGAVYLGCCLAASLECVSHLRSQHKSNKEEKRNAKEDNEGEEPVYRCKVDKGCNNGDACDDNVLGTVVSKLAYLEKVVCHTGHDLSRIVIIVIAVGETLEMIEYAKALGVRALECYYSEHSPAQQAWMLRQAERYGLGVTGGSDYHGTRKTHITMGRGTGNMEIPYAVLEQLKALAGKIDN